MATLYLVSTPIGNLGDISSRAVSVLTSADRILAEDTRRTRVLTQHVGALAPLVSVHAHNEAERVQRVLDWLDEGETLALVSDAGTPLVSDPGGRLVDAVWEAGHTVVPVPGASAVLAALVASGLPADRFCFLGFLDRKGRGRRDVLERIAGSEESVVLFESPKRLVRLLEDLALTCGGGRRVAVARELTKLHEEFFRGTLEEAVGYYGDHPPRGEVTVVVAPGDASQQSRDDVEKEARILAARLLEEGLKPSAAAREVTVHLDLPRNVAYRIVHEIANS